MSRLLKIHTKTTQVQEFLENEIRIGHLKVGERLQSMRTLADRFGVSTMVINSALDGLERKHLVRRLPRQGIIISDPANTAEPVILEVYSPGSQDSSTPYILPEFESACGERNVRVERIDIDFLYSGDRDKVLRQLAARNFYCVLLCGAGYRGDEPEVTLLQTLGVPVVIPHGEVGDFKATGFAVFYSDTRRIWRDALGSLAQQGFRHVGALGLLRNGKESWRAGGAAEHLLLLEELGLEPIAPIAPEFDDVAAFDRALGAYLAEHPQIEALLCHSDFVALKVYHYCRRHKIRIPQDLAVMGICGYPGGSLLSPALSTVDMQYARIGRSVAEWICDGRDAKSAEPVFLSPHTIITGESAQRIK